MGRVCYGPSLCRPTLLWAEFAMGRVCYGPRCPVTVENTGQPGRDNPMSRPGCVSENTGHWIVPSRLSRVFSLKTRDSQDGTIQCPVPVVCLKIRDIELSRPGCPVFSRLVHGDTHNINKITVTASPEI